MVLHCGGGVGSGRFEWFRLDGCASVGEQLKIYGTEIDDCRKSLMFELQNLLIREFAQRRFYYSERVDFRARQSREMLIDMLYARALQRNRPLS
jgi:hypothetical protein